MTNRLRETAGIVHSIAQPCAKCGADTKHRRECVVCGTLVVYVAPPKKPKAELEDPIKKRIRAAVIAAGCICWIHNVDNRKLSTGLGLGTSDLICIVPPGRFLGIEVKRPGYSPSDVRPAQRAWLDAVRKFGGISGIATCEAEALALVDEARQSLSIDVISHSHRTT